MKKDERRRPSASSQAQITSADSDGRNQTKHNKKQDKAAETKFDQWQMLQNFKLFCDDAEGEDKVQAQSLLNRTLFIAPSPTNAIKVHGKLKGRGRNDEQKAADKQIASKFSQWLREQQVSNTKPERQPKIRFVDEKEKAEQWIVVRQT